jgi:hypothetical protein
VLPSAHCPSSPPPLAASWPSREERWRGEVWRKLQRWDQTTELHPQHGGRFEHGGGGFKRSGSGSERGGGRFESGGGGSELDGGGGARCGKRSAADLRFGCRSEANLRGRGPSPEVPGSPPPLYPSFSSPSSLFVPQVVRRRPGGGGRRSGGGRLWWWRGGFGGFLVMVLGVALVVVVAVAVLPLFCF